ncbi:MAG: tetratricopeptide repeat protein [Planctomycetota bacterium]
MKLRFSLPLCLLLEGLSAAVVLVPLPVWARLLLLTIGHGLASFAICPALHKRLPERLQEPAWWARAWIFVTCLFLPVFGALGLLTTLFVLSKLPAIDRRQPWRLVESPSLSIRKRPHNAELPYGDGGLLGVVRYASDPQRRMDAILSTQQLPARESVPILHTALKDGVDEVRLLAYSMLDRMELRINGRITEMREALEGASPELAAQLHHKLGEQYWELADSGLAQGDVRRHMVATAQKHGDESLALESHNAQAHLLLGRVRLEQSDLDEAQRHLEIAIVQGMAPSEVAALMADIAFRRRDFRATRAALRKADPLSLRTRPLSQVSSLWQ